MKAGFCIFADTVRFAFENCKGLETQDGMRIAGNVLLGVSSDFAGTLTIPDNIDSIVAEIFYNNKTITSISFPKGIKFIGAYAFRGCENLRSTIFEDGVSNLKIEEGIFLDCNNIAMVKLPELQIRKWYPLNAEENLPVIIASHGSCGTIDNNASLYRELASHGYTVLAVCHPGQTASITYKDGKSAGPSMAFLKQMSALQPQKDPEQAYEIFSEWMDIRSADLNAVMDDYEKYYGETEFVMLGHSLGGSAAYAITRTRDDVIGCIALEAPCMYDIKGTSNGEFIFDDSDYNVPLMNIYSDSAYDHLHEWGQYRNNAMFIDGGNPLYTNIHYEGIGHMGLCDLSIASPLLSAVLSGKIQNLDAYTQLKMLNEDCLKWLDTLK